MTVVGELTLWVALFLSVWGSAASIIGGKLRRPELGESATRVLGAAAAMLMLAAAGLWRALLGHDFSLRYVTSHTTLNTPTFFLLTAFWAGPAGRMLFFALALALAGAVAIAVERRLEPAIRVAASGALATLLALALLVVCFGTNPYDRVEWVPAEGQGLDPQLQTPLAALYFVTTYGGYGAATVVLGLGVGAALVGRTNREWYRAMGNWCLASWCLLTVAVATRMRWSYLEPESGGFQQPDAAQVTTAVVWALSLILLISVGRRSDASRRRTAKPAVRLASAVVLGLGLAMIVGGVAARRLWTDHAVSVRPGESAALTDRLGSRWRFVSQGVSRDEQPNHLSTSVALETWRDGDRVGFVSAERRQYLDSMQRPTFEPALIPGVESSPALDVYVLLSGLRGDRAEMRIGFRPFVAGVWAGWVLVLAGGVALALVPRGRGSTVAGTTAPA